MYETNNDTEGLEVEERKVVGVKGLEVFGLLFDAKFIIREMAGNPRQSFTRCLSVPRKFISFDRDQVQCPVGWLGGFGIIRWSERDSQRPVDFWHFVTL